MKYETEERSSAGVTRENRFRVGSDAGDAAGIELHYRVRGEGTPIVFVNGGFMSSWFELVMAEAALATAYQLIDYDRPGYGGSSRPAGLLSMEGQAACCTALVNHLGLRPAHLVGHSIGACIALQAALDGGSGVASLALLEPPVLTAVKDPSGTIRLIRESAGRWQQRDRAGALDVFMKGLVDADYRQVLAGFSPAASAEALRETDAFYGVDQPAISTWKFLRPDAAQVKQPVLMILGANSSAVNPMREEIQRELLEWLPNASGLVVAGATHLLTLQEPRVIAESLAAFYRRIGS